MDELLVGLRAVAETTRIRVLFALAQGEFNVSELTHILGQSQPRVSRHLKLMVEAGLITRHKEGNWVLFRLREEGLGGALARAIGDLLPNSDHALAQDLAMINDIKHQRQQAAAHYFSHNAANWQRQRSLHIDEYEVERTLLTMLGNDPVDLVVDLGTGTGRMLELLAPLAKQLLGIDSSREMLALARANIEQHSLRHAQVRQGDIYDLPIPASSADLVILHQVLHFLDNPQQALQEAQRVLSTNGRLLIVDFAPHDLETLRSEHAHRRLGIATEQLSLWFQRAGLRMERHELLPPPWRKDTSGLTVSIWLAQNAAQPPVKRTVTHPLPLPIIQKE